MFNVVIRVCSLSAPQAVVAAMRRRRDGDRPSYTVPYTPLPVSPPVLGDAPSPWRDTTLTNTFSGGNTAEHYSDLD